MTNATVTNTGSDGRMPNHFATLLSAAGEAIHYAGQDLCGLPIAVTGRWVKNGQEFSITLADLEAMARNFSKRKNDQVVIDYEHASETPGVALGGPVPAAGWIHGLSVIGGVGAQRAALQAELHALIEWTPEARRMIRGGQYRFFSPSIDWNYRDKETGEPQGATLTSGALTNHPFLEELPPIMLTDFAGGAALSAASRNLAGSAAAPADPPLTRTARLASSRTAGETPALPTDSKETPMKQLNLKKLEEGPHAGHHGVFDGDAALGFVDAGEFCDYAQQHLGAPGAAAPAGNQAAAGTGDDDASDCPSRKLAERIGVTPATTFAELRRRLAAAPDAESASARVLLLTEATRDGKLDNARAAALAREGRIALADYIAAQEADRRLDEAVRAGKILPPERRFFFRDALERPAEFAEYVRQAAPRLALGITGIGSGVAPSVDDEVKALTENLMAQERLSYSKALKRVFASDRELAERYQSMHRRRLSGDGSAENAGGIAT